MRREGEAVEKCGRSAGEVKPEMGAKQRHLSVSPEQILPRYFFSSSSSSVGIGGLTPFLERLKREHKENIWVKNPPWI